MKTIQRTLILGLLLGLLASGLAGIVAAQDPKSSGPTLEATDPKGDVGFLIPPPTTGASNPLVDSLDLTSLKVYGEDLEGLYIELGIAGFKSAPAGSDWFATFGSVQYNTRFKVDGSNIQYMINWFVPRDCPVVCGDANPPSGIQPIGARLCIQPEGRGCFQQRVIGQVDFDKGLIIAYVPKSSLAGREPVGQNQRDPPPMPAMGPGTRLVQFTVEAYGAFWRDILPNQGAAGPYTLQSIVPNERVRLSLADREMQDEGPNDPYAYYYGPAAASGFPAVSVTPGASSLVQIKVSNENAGKRIVNLTADFVDPKDATKWDLRILRTLTIPGTSARIVNLIVNATPQVQHRDESVVRLMARSLGFQDEIGAMKIKLVAAVPPGPLRKDLFPHATTRGSLACFGCTANLWMNTLEEDPLGTGDAGTGMGLRGLNPLTTELRAEIRLDAPLNEDLNLDITQPASATVLIRSTTPTPGSIRVEVQSGQGLIGTGNAPYASGPVTIPFTPLAEAARIPAGETLLWRVVLTVDGPYPQGFFTNDLAPKFVAAESKLTLPIIPDPRPKSAAKIPLGPAFLTLSSEGDPEEFVNPGRVKVFPVTVVNEGVQEDIVRVSFEKDPETWYVDLTPGDAFRLKPGESAKFGVMVKPPSGAKEGEQQHILLNATSDADPSALAQLSLTAIVTENVDIADESENFTADNDTADKLAIDEGGRSPGLGSVAVLAVSAGLVAAFRRRRTG